VSVDVESRYVHDLVAQAVTNCIKRFSVHSDKIVKGNTQISYIHMYS
jgi:hypothetical protein